METSKSFYEILNLASDAYPDEIRSSFRKLAKIHHPDKNNNSEESQIDFQIIYNAYKTLSDSEKRKDYDQYLKTSSVLKIKTKDIFKKSDNSMVYGNRNNSLEYLCGQFNYILWEVEDILKAAKNSHDKKIYSGHTVDQWIFKVLNFIDKWVLVPSGFIDYFYEARRINNLKSLNSIEENFKNKIYKPYVNISDYFFDVRMRMNKFIDKINLHDVLMNINGSRIKIIDSIIESLMFSFHYLGSLNLILKNNINEIRKFNYSNKCYEEDAKGLIDF